MKQRTGLAFLLLLLVFSTGILTESRQASASLERCRFTTPIHCEDYVVTDEADHSNGTAKVPGITLVLLNGAGRSMHVKSISARPEPSGLFGKANGKYNCSWVKPGSDDRGVLLTPGKAAQFSLTNSSEREKEEGCPYNYDSENADWYSVELSYAWADSLAIDHVVKGNLGRSELSRFETDVDVYGNTSDYILFWFAIPLWLVISIYLIKRGRSDKAGLNAEGKTGIAFIVALIALVAGKVILGMLSLPDEFFYVYFYTYLVIPLIALALLGAGSVYAARKKAKLPRIPLLILAIIFAVTGMLSVAALLRIIT